MNYISATMEQKIQRKEMDGVSGLFGREEALQLRHL